MKIHDLSLYGSHIPVLVRVLEQSDGPILDLGMGLSTIVMHMMAKETKREIVSYDSDKDWYEANKQYETDWHKIKFVENWDDISKEITSRHWDVAMIDHKPAKRRRVEMGLLAKHANYVIVHDTEPESDKFFKYTWKHKLYKYKWEYIKCRPNTSVFSNFVDLQSLDRK